MGDIRAENVYRRALHDALFLERLRDAYVGQWDPLDALWWEFRPRETSPSGRSAPASELSELQRRLFSRSGDASGDQATTVLMRELEKAISAERAALKAALDATESGRGTEPHSEESRGNDASTSPHELEAVASSAESPAVADAPDRRRQAAVALGVIAALIVGVFAGTQLTERTEDAAPSATPTPRAPKLDVGAQARRALFEIPQLSTDIPAITVPETFDLASFRMLSRVGPSGGEPMDTFFAARTTSNMTCLVRAGSNPDYLSTCVLDADFPATGLRLNWSGEITEFVTEGGEVVRSPVDKYAIWMPDGTMEWR